MVRWWWRSGGGAGSGAVLASSEASFFFIYIYQSLGFLVVCLVEYGGLVGLVGRNGMASLFLVFFLFI